MTENGRSTERWRGIWIRAVILVAWTGARVPCLAQGTPAPSPLAVVAAQFHTRDQEDAGEVRICLGNTGTAYLSMAQLTVRVTMKGPDEPNWAGEERKCVYARLSPPVLPPGHYGQLVAKLLDRPANGHTLTCTVSAPESPTSPPILVTDSGLWISYVGFSQDLRRIFVYVENGTDAVVRLESVQAGEADSSATAIPRLVPPQGKGCLMCRLSPALSPGDFTHIAVSAKKDNQNIRLHTIVRALNRIPLMLVESGTPAPDLELDLEGFTETMTCIAHAHGTHEQAASTFWEDYVRRFRQNPQQIIQLDICRSDSPRSWFRFGCLPDIARMNPILFSPPSYDEEDHRLWFSPFFYRGHLAKRAVEPCRYLAVLPIVPEERLFLQNELTAQEMRFLVYCAVASGAKGLGYRGRLTADPLQRSAFVRLNRELRQMESLLLIGEPVDWAVTTDRHYAATSLLCGDQAVLVMVFDRRYFSQQRDRKFYTPPFGRAATPAKVDVKIPREVSVGQVRSLSAPLDPGTWICREDHLSFTADMVDSAQIYVVDLQSQTQPPGARGGSP